MRCTSRYLPRNTEGIVIGDPIRCTLEVGHFLSFTEEMHQNLRPGHKVRWPDSAQMPPAIPPYLCGVGGCVFNKHEKGHHSWQR